MLKLFSVFVLGVVAAVLVFVLVLTLILILVLILVFALVLVLILVAVLVLLVLIIILVIHYIISFRHVPFADLYAVRIFRTVILFTRTRVPIRLGINIFCNEKHVCGFGARQR